MYTNEEKQSPEALCFKIILLEVLALTLNCLSKKLLYKVLPCRVEHQPDIGRIKPTMKIMIAATILFFLVLRHLNVDGTPPNRAESPFPRSHTNSANRRLRRISEIGVSIIRIDERVPPAIKKASP